MAKKSFTMSTESLLNRTTPKATTEEKKPVGRPRINTHKTTSTSQEGLREGLTRMTFIVDQDKQDKLKYISYYERMSLREILAQAIDDYLNKYETQFGPINVN